MAAPIRRRSPPLARRAGLAVTLGLLAVGLTGACDRGGTPASTRASDSDPNGADAPPPSGPDAAPHVAAAADPTPEAETPAAEPTPPPEPKWEPRKEDRKAAEHPLVNGDRLTHFYAQLARVDDGDQELVRVSHWGGSMIGGDDLPGVLRGLFQARFGDGGAGMVMLQRYMDNYRQRWVVLEAKRWGNCYIGYLCRKDGHYGLGGVSFESTPGATTKIRTRKDAPGDTVSSFDVYYAKRKGGGKLHIRVDGGEPEKLSTSADALEDAFHRIDVAPGAHEIELRAPGNKVRAYGVVLETDGPGLVWDQFSWLGAFTKRMHGWDPEHIAGQVAHRDPHLLVFTYGGNDSRRFANKKLTPEKYTAEYVEGIERARAGKPDASCLIIGSSDRGKSLTYTIDKTVMQTLSDAQKAAADEAGCAFFDTLAAMGGPGSIRTWRRKKPPLAAPDQKHLNHAGREVLGGWIYDAIVAGYVEHRTTD